MRCNSCGNATHKNVVEIAEGIRAGELSRACIDLYAVLPKSKREPIYTPSACERELEQALIDDLKFRRRHMKGIICEQQAERPSVAARSAPTETVSSYGGVVSRSIHYHPCEQAGGCRATGFPFVSPERFDERLIGTGLNAVFGSPILE